MARVADRFALIAAGGELAAGFGIVPWPAGEAVRAAARCLADWRRGRGGDGPAEAAAGLAQVRRFLEVNGEGRFRLIGGEADAPKADGPEKVSLLLRILLIWSESGCAHDPEVWR